MTIRKQCTLEIRPGNGARVSLLITPLAAGTLEPMQDSDGETIRFGIDLDQPDAGIAILTKNLCTFLADLVVRETKDQAQRVREAVAQEPSGEPRRSPQKG